jgi:hypothetical protein
MPAWTKYNQVDPEFFAARGENSWSIDAPEGRISSRFGFGEIRVQLKADGSPDFDRLVVGEAPNINCVVWGRDTDGTYKVAVVTQARPFSDMPDGSPAELPIAFGQPCVMGFRANLGGSRNLAKAFEAADDAAVREALEEAGAAGVVSIRQMGHHNPNPTFVATWSELYEIEVDLTKIREFTDHSELIYRADYVSVREVLRRISEGEHEGANYRSATANDALFVWIARHPEALG